MTPQNPSSSHPMSRRLSWSIRQRIRAFTLIELLIVVAIITILASIATPNFLEAQVRSKVSRVKSDMRTMATALEAYAIDSNKYPPRSMYHINGLVQAYVGLPQTRMTDLPALTTPVAYISNVPIDIFESPVHTPYNIIDYWPPSFMEEFLNRRLKFEQEQEPGTEAEPLPPELIWANYPYAAHRHVGFVLISVGPDGIFGEDVPPIPIQGPAVTPTPIISVGLIGGGGDCPNPGVVPTPTPERPELSVFKTYDPTNGTVSYGNIFRFQAVGVEPGSVFYK